MINTLVISTRDRQDQALAALLSFQQGLQRPVTSIVYDQTNGPCAYPSTRVCGPKQVAQYIEVLRQLGFPQEILEFGLIGGYGGYRNVALLDTVGEQVLSADDDVRHQVYAPPDQDLNRITLDRLKPYGAWYKNRAEWYDGLEQVLVNLLTEHERLLGKQVGSKSVRITSCGFVGDAAADYNYFALPSIGKERERLLADYATARATREVMQAFQTLTVSHQPWLRTLSYAYDNTLPLPPFLPNGRGECSVFATLLTTLQTESIGHIPWAVAHMPPDRQGYKPIQFGLDGCFYSLRSACGQTTWTGIATALEAFGKLTPKQARGFMQEYHTRSLKPYCDTLRTLLNTYNRKPDLWAQDAEEFLRQAETPVQFDDQTTLWMQHQMVMFGKFLNLWSELWYAAKRLKDQGIRVSTPSKYDTTIAMYTRMTSQATADSPNLAINLHEEIGLKDTYLLRTLNEDHVKTVVDIGANYGFFALFARALFPSARIVCIEPEPTTYKALVGNTKTHNIQPFHGALGNDNQFVTLQPVDASDPKSSRASYVSVDTSDQTGTPSYRLPALLKRLGISADSTTVIKIDCEGAERHIVEDQGSIEVLRRTGHWAMEVHYDSKIWPACLSSDTYRNFAAQFETTHEIHLDFGSSFGTITATMRD